MKLTSKNIFTDANGIKGYITHAHISGEDFLNAVKDYELRNFHRATAYDEKNVKQMYYRKVDPSNSDYTIYVFVTNEKLGYAPCTMMYR